MFPAFLTSSPCTSLYVHIPFCRKICPFCSFVVRRDRAGAHMEYLEALLDELEFSLGDSTHGRSSLDSVYFGGGTPSRLTVEELKLLLKGIHKRWPFDPEVEITMECNPEDVNQESIKGWLHSGINRFSLGGQSFQDLLLKKLGRVHNAEQLRSAISCFQKEKLENWNLDLMFGIPGQTLSEFNLDLDEALNSDPNHLSLYGLEVHPGTPYFHDSEVRKWKERASELEKQFYLKAVECTASKGLQQYEISNFARTGFQSRSNLRVWDGSPYLGLGCGAHSFDGVQRWGNLKSMRRYLEKIRQKEVPRDFTERPNLRQRAGETLMLALRRPEGLDFQAWQNRFGLTCNSVKKFQLETLAEKKLISWEPPNLRLTSKGMLLADAITSELMPEP